MNVAAVPLTESLPGYDELEQTQTEAKQEPVMVTEYTQTLSLNPPLFITQVSSLSNGVKIASKEVPNSPYVRLGVYVNCGSRVESYHKLGLSHLLRHCAFLVSTVIVLILVFYLFIYLFTYLFLLRAQKKRRHIC